VKYLNNKLTAPSAKEL